MGLCNRSLPFLRGLFELFLDENGLDIFRYHFTLCYPLRVFHRSSKMPSDGGWTTCDLLITIIAKTDGIFVLVFSNTVHMKRRLRTDLIEHILLLCHRNCFSKSDSLQARARPNSRSFGTWCMVHSLRHCTDMSTHMMITCLRLFVILAILAYSDY